MKAVATGALEVRLSALVCLRLCAPLSNLYLTVSKGTHLRSFESVGGRKTVRSCARSRVGKDR
jgi:hypothetical protein